MQRSVCGNSSRQTRETMVLANKKQNTFCCTQMLLGQTAGANTNRNSATSEKSNDTPTYSLKWVISRIQTHCYFAVVWVLRSYTTAWRKSTRHYFITILSLLSIQMRKRSRGQCSADRNRGHTPEKNKIAQIFLLQHREINWIFGLATDICIHLRVSLLDWS